MRRVKKGVVPCRREPRGRPERGRLGTSIALLLAAPCIAATAFAQDDGEPTGAARDDAALERPAILDREPESLPRNQPGRWNGFFDEERLPQHVAALPEAVREDLQRAEAAYLAADYPRALEHLFAVLEAEADLPPAWLVLGTTYFRLRRYGDAAVAFERFLDVAPEEVWRTQALGHAYYSLGEYAKAREHYERVLAGANGSVEATRGLALAHLRLGDEERALALLDEVLELDPEHVEAPLWIARILYDQGRSEEALPHAERARDRAPYEPGPWFVLTQVLFDLGRDDDAAKAEARWRELDRVAQERRLVEGLLRIHPRRFDLAVRLVELARSIGDVDGTRAALELLLASRPPEVSALEVHIKALDVLWELNDREGAQIAADALEKVCPDEPEAWRRLELHYAMMRDRRNQVRAGELYRRLK